MKIRIEITLISDVSAPLVFAHVQEAKASDVSVVWPSIVSGLELVLSKIHRHFFPTEEEKAADSSNGKLD